MVFLDCLLVVVVIFVRSLFSSEYLIFSTQTYPVKLGECVCSVNRMWLCCLLFRSQLKTGCETATPPYIDFNLTRLFVF